MFKKEIYQADQEATGIELREDQEKELKKREQLKLSVEKVIIEVIDVDIAGNSPPPTGYILKDLEVLKSHLLPHLQGADNIFAKKSGKLIRDILYDDGTGIMVTEGIKEGLAVDELIEYLEAKISQTPPPANVADIRAIKVLLAANNDFYGNLHADVTGNTEKLEGRILTEGYFVGKNRGVEYENNGLDARHIRNNSDTTIQGNPNSPDSVINQKKIEADYFRARNLIAGDGANPSERKETTLKELDLDTLRRSLNQAKVAEFLKTQGVTDIANDAQFKQAIYAEMWEILNKEKEAYPVLEDIIKKFKDGADSSTLTAEFTNLAQKIGFKDTAGNSDFNKIKQIYDDLNKLLKSQAAQNIKKRKQTKNLIVSGVLAAGGIGVGICALPVAVLGIVGAGTAMYTGLGISGARIGKSIVDWLGLKGKQLEKEISKMRAKLMNTATDTLTTDSAVLAEKKVNYECGLEFAKHFAARLAQEKQRDIDNLFMSAPATMPAERRDLELAKSGYIDTLEAKGLDKISPSKRQKIIDNARNSATEYQDFNQTLEKQRTVYAKEVVDFLKERYPDISDEEAREYAIAVAVYYEMTERGNLEIAEYEKLGIKGWLEGLYDSKLGKVMSAGGGGSEKERMANGLALTVGGALIRAGKFYFKAKHGTLAEIVNWTTNLGGRLLMSHGFGLGARGLTEFAKREALATITYENFRKADSEEKKQAILAKGEALLRDKERIIKKDSSARTALERVAEEVEKMRQYFIISADNILARLSEDATHSIDAAGNFTQVDISKVNEVLQIEDKFKQAGEAYRKKEKAGQAVRRNDIAARLLGFVAFDIGEWAYKKFIPDHHKPPVRSGGRGGGYGHGRRPATPFTPITPREPGEMAIPAEAVVGHHEGVEHSIIRQLEVDPQKWGWSGKGDAHHWAQTRAHQIAIEEGYVRGGGLETRVRPEDRVAYLLTGNKDNPEVQEFLVNRGPKGDYVAEGPMQEGGGPGEAQQWYEYEHGGRSKGAGAIPEHQPHQPSSGAKSAGSLEIADSKSTDELTGIPLTNFDEHSAGGNAKEMNLAPAEPSVDIHNLEPRDFAPTNAEKTLQEAYFLDLIKNRGNHDHLDDIPEAVRDQFKEDMIKIDGRDVNIAYQKLADDKIGLDMNFDGKIDAVVTPVQTKSGLNAIVDEIRTYKDSGAMEKLDLKDPHFQDRNLNILAREINGDYKAANNTLRYLETGAGKQIFCGRDTVNVPSGAEIKLVEFGPEQDNKASVDWDQKAFALWNDKSSKGVLILDKNQDGILESLPIQGRSLDDALESFKKGSQGQIMEVIALDKVFGHGKEPIPGNFNGVHILQNNMKAAGFESTELESAESATLSTAANKPAPEQAQKGGEEMVDDFTLAVNNFDEAISKIDFDKHLDDSAVQTLLSGLLVKSKAGGGDQYLAQVLEKIQQGLSSDTAPGVKQDLPNLVKNFDQLKQDDYDFVVQLLKAAQEVEKAH